MNRGISVAYDGSEGSLLALAAAAEQTKLASYDLSSVHIIDWSPYSFHTPQELKEQHRRREPEIAKANKSVLGPVT